MRAERAEMMKTDVIRVKWDQASGAWLGLLADVGEWLPLPFTAQASPDCIEAFYAGRGQLVVWG
jgi:hypothetical protein